MAQPQLLDEADARLRQQEEELESLRLIYSDEFVQRRADAEEAGVTVVEVKLGKSPAEAEADGKERLVILRAYLSAEYPSAGAEMPLFELKGVNWSRRDQNAVFEGRWRAVWVWSIEPVSIWERFQRSLLHAQRL